jgi:hypothetical protein
MAIWFLPANMSSLLGWFLGNAITHKILAFAEKKVISSSLIEVYHGIGICDINSDKSDDRKFLECTKKALDCIKKVDSAVFNRVKRELKYIVNRELASSGVYSKLTKSCKIDFGRYKFDLDYDWCFYSYISTIIHEATHGYIASKGIGYNKENRGRIEEICEKASARFLRKTSYKNAEEIIGKFDESRWHFYWNASAWEETKIILKRMRESRQKELERSSYEDSNNVC